MTPHTIPFSIYIYLNGNLALNDRTAAGVANAMRCSKDKAGAILTKMVDEGYLTYEPIGNYRVFFVNHDYARSDMAEPAKTEQMATTTDHN